MAETDSDAAAAWLTRDILSGVHPPRGKLKVRDLSGRYDIGATPLREALSRLAASGLVEQEGQRGFRVPPVTREHLLDITHTRQVIEAEAFRLAMAHGEAAWEDEIAASMSVLERAARRRQATEAWLDEYEARHHRFHRALIAACPYKTLLAFCDNLYAQTTRYRRVMASLGGVWDQTVPAHQRLADCAHGRDPARGMDMIRDHIGSTARDLLDVIGT